MSTAFWKNFLMVGKLKHTLKSDFQQRSPDFCFDFLDSSSSKKLCCDNKVQLAFPRFFYFF